MKRLGDVMISLIDLSLGGNEDPLKLLFAASLLRAQHVGARAQIQSKVSCLPVQVLLFELGLGRTKQGS